MEREQNRVSGVFKVLFGLGFVASGLAFWLAGLAPVALPLVGCGLWLAPAGGVQAITGAGEDY